MEYNQPQGIPEGYEQSNHQPNPYYNNVSLLIMKSNSYYNYNYYNNYPVDNSAYEFKSNFPCLMYYDTEEEIRKAFAPCSDFNIEEKDLSEVHPGYMYVIKPNTLHNIHKAVKYGIWTSNPRNNEILSNSFNDAKGHGLSVFLLFTTVKSNGFLGLAEMTTAHHPGMSFKYWQDENRWFGSFKLKWHFIKDVPSSYFSELKEY